MSSLPEIYQSFLVKGIDFTDKDKSEKHVLTLEELLMTEKEKARNLCANVGFNMGGVTCEIMSRLAKEIESANLSIIFAQKELQQAKSLVYRFSELSSYKCTPEKERQEMEDRITTELSKILLSCKHYSDTTDIYKSIFDRWVAAHQIPLIAEHVPKDESKGH